jgi:hypothetical protein
LVVAVTRRFFQRASQQRWSWATVDSFGGCMKP